jgi:hypothetical protein
MPNKGEHATMANVASRLGNKQISSNDVIHTKEANPYCCQQN